jgi:glucose/arabinose dehydrogenase
MTLTSATSEPVHQTESKENQSPIGLVYRIVFLLFGTAVLLTMLSHSSPGATLPGGFTESQVASALANPTAMEFAPDGRLFVCEQAGRLRIIKDGVLLATPFLTITVNSSGERGLLGVTFDPAFSSNQYIYVYYTANTPAIHNRISRFTANGDVAVPNSEAIIFDLDNLGSSANHNAGAIHFGEDGRLYIAVGDNFNSANSQTLTNLLGKMLRINSDGSIPSDNPFYTTATAKNRAIWALGLRNPFTFAIQPITGRVFINDVGQSSWEEINDGVAGSNYGWPDTEGYTSNPTYRSPIFAYGHGSGDTLGCAITGGTFYNPTTEKFPNDYVGDYFFADYCNGWIQRLEPADIAVTGFATGIARPVDLKVSADGNLYYLARGSGSDTGVIYNVRYTATQEPNITTQPADQVISVGQSATFSISASGASPLSYQWQRNGSNISGATSPSYTIASVQLSDDGALFRCVVSNSLGSATSNEARLTVTTNAKPTVSITKPAAGTLYKAGATIYYAGTGTDPEDGTLPASAFSWQVDFHHDTHVHPFIQPTSGAKSGSFKIPTTGETSANVWYRIYLTVKDSGGLTATSFVNILPRKSTVTLATSPAGFQVKLDGQPLTTPTSFIGVVGIIRKLEAVSPQTANGTTYKFLSWSDGGSTTHNIATPANNTTYTASFTNTPPAAPSGLAAAAVSSSQINLVWTDNADNETGFRIRRSSDGGATFSLIATVGANFTSYSDKGLSASTTYYYVIRAYNPVGNSALSKRANATTP